MLNSNNIVNHIYFEKYSNEIECFKKYYKFYNINKNMLFYNYKHNKNRALVSFLSSQFPINWTFEDSNKYFNYYQCIIIGLYINEFNNVYYCLEITNLKNNNINTVAIPYHLIGKGNKINWKKEKYYE